MEQQREQINYVEYAAEQLEETKRFFELLLDWHFTEWGLIISTPILNRFLWGSTAHRLPLNPNKAQHYSHSTALRSKDLKKE